MSPLRLAELVLLLAALVLCPVPSVQASKIVTLGDSFSAGTGIHLSILDYYPPGRPTETFNGVTYEFSSIVPLCAREGDTTPGARLARDLGMEAVMVACSGAQTPNLFDQIDYLNAKYPEEHATNWSGSMIIMTIGLNDLRSVKGTNWLDLLYYDCIFNPFRDCAADLDNQVGNLEFVKANMKAALQYLVSEASEATIRILGYGKLFQRNGQDCDSFGISNDEADLFDNGYFDLINSLSSEVIADVKADTPVPANGNIDIEFIDVDSYLSVGSCNKGDNEPHLKGYETCFLVPYSVASFHPTQLGYDQYLQALVDNLGVGTR